jgi:flavin reductase (DIM6/NTAB) family NADH-FMN oxidoreductase RutF
VIRPEEARMEYVVVPPKEAYALLNCGGVVLVCTKASAGHYDLAPVAWACPLDYEPTSRVLFVCDPSHATHANILARRDFALALPSLAQRDLVLRSGSISGRDSDKYEALRISSFEASEIDVLIPSGVAGWLECRLLRTVAEGSSSVVMGEVVAARAVEGAWRQRLHYVSESLSYAPGPEL